MDSVLYICELANESLERDGSYLTASQFCVRSFVIEPSRDENGLLRASFFEAVYSVYEHSVRIV